MQGNTLVETKTEWLKSSDCSINSSKNSGCRVRSQLLLPAFIEILVKNEVALSFFLRTASHDWLHKSFDVWSGSSV